jgi:hypothetical protein
VADGDDYPDAHPLADGHASDALGHMDTLADANADEHTDAAGGMVGMRHVATLAGIYRYPVKGMRGQALDRVFLGWHGLEGDRRFAFADDDARSGFPWLTGRKAAALIRYAPFFDGDRVEGPPEIVRVTTPSGEQHGLDSQLLHDELALLFRRPVRLFRMGRGCFDSMPVSMISRATAKDIGERLGMTLDPRRFRPNLLIEILPGLAEREEDWLDRTLAFGEGEDSPRLRLNRRNKRCVMITLDPDTGEASPEILKAVAREREECAGLYGSVERPGELAAGAPIFLA